MAYCGVCGTDIHEYLAGPILCPGHSTPNPSTGADLPVILGHEFSGTIVEIGSAVTADFAVGQKVAVNPCLDDRHLQKPDCEFCAAGRRNLCTSSAFYGITANGGGFADEIVVSPHALVRLPDHVPLKLAALAEPLSVAAHMIRISGFQKGQDAVVLGAGPIGCALTFLLKESDAQNVIVSEVSSSRRTMASSSGADHVVDPLSSKAAVTDQVKEVMGNGADVTFDAAGLQATLDTAFACTKSGGTVFNVAIHDSPKQLNMNFLTLPEKKLMAGNAYTAEDFARVVKVLGERTKEVEKFVTGVVSLEDAVKEGFEPLIHGGGGHNKIVVEVQGDS